MQKRTTSYPEVFDTIIIGAGPAGMTASIYAARRKMKTLLVCGEIGGQMNWCSDIENWTGVEQSTGPALKDQFYRHVHQVDEDNDHFDLWVEEGVKVKKVQSQQVEKLKSLKVFEVQTDRGDVYRSKTVICTTGKIPRMLGVPGEKEAMRGKGLSFAATSDAPLYKDKKMVVIGGGNSAMDVALQLEKYTNDITIVTNLNGLIGEAILMEKVQKSLAIKTKFLVKTEEILLNKEGWVDGIRYKQALTPTLSQGEREQKVDDVFKLDDSDLIEETIDCEGIFEEIGQVPATKFLNGFVDMNQWGEIISDRLCHTSVPGFFAAGDCNDGVHKQVIVATGEGAVAALQAHEYVLKS